MRYSPNHTSIPGGAQIDARLLILISIPPAIWVFVDARRRLRPLPSVAWALGTLLAVVLVGPAYIMTRPSKAQTWGLGEVFAIILFFVGAVLLLAGLLASHDQVVPSFGMIAILTVMQNVVLVAAAVYIVVVKYRLPLSSLGLAVGRWSLRLLQGAIAAAVGLVGNFVGQNATVYALGLAMGNRTAEEFVTREETNTPIYRLLPQVHQRLDLILLVILVGVVVPIGEEIFFRGLTYGALRRLLKRPAAVVLSALFFAVAHIAPVELLPILILGVILAYLYEYTGSLVPGMIAHGVNNLAALLIFYHTPVPPS